MTQPSKSHTIMPAILHPSKQMPNSSDGTGQDIDSTSQRIGGPSFKTTTTHICKLKNKTHFYLISPGLNYPSLWQPLLTNSLCIFPERRYSQTQAFFFLYTEIQFHIYRHPCCLPWLSKHYSNSGTRWIHIASWMNCLLMNSCYLLSERKDRSQRFQ